MNHNILGANYLRNLLLPIYYNAFLQINREKKVILIYQDEINVVPTSSLSATLNV